jgi:hypothetical protein
MGRFYSNLQGKAKKYVVIYSIIIKLQIMPFILIHPIDFHTEIPSEPGVYKIYSLNDNHIPRPINRIGGIDNQGILYIGESQNLKERLRMLWRVLNPNYLATAHTFGINYNTVPLLQEIFPLNSLAVTFEIIQDHTNYETMLIENYRQLYGEVPPFNGKK